MAWKSDFLSDLLESVHVIKKNMCQSIFDWWWRFVCTQRPANDLFGRFVQPSCASSKPKIYIVSLHSLWQFGLQFFPLAIMVHSILHSLNLSDTPKWTIMAISFHHYKSLGLRHLEGLRLYSPFPSFKGWNVNPVKWMRFPQWGLTLQRSFFSASWPQARCPERPFLRFKHVHTDKHHPFA